MKQQQKNKILLAAIFGFALVVYFFGVKKTIELVRDNDRLQGKMMSAGDLNKGIADYKEKLAGFQSNFGMMDTNKQISHEVILAQLGQFCSDYKLLLKEFPSVVVHEETGYRVETNAIVVEGSFQNIVKLLFFLESEHKIGRIASVKFLTEENRKTQTLKLVAKIYVQNIKQLRDEA